ncbi:MAG: hypothetical protein DWH96_00395 [Planctomycetota bacterium]|nr:MAG: hypothetical protein DWH96_00395 [Planctomycetota bacterium]RLS95744.1 MAG: hypothetical protein DWI11_02030 [Planctomycetota bacterium]
MRRPFLSSYLTLVTLACSGSIAHAEQVLFVRSGPDLDRWNYPFNSSPGMRPTASTFGNEAGATMFDNRDGQMIVGWNTSSEIPTGLGVDGYTIDGCIIELMVANDFVFSYDSTVDPFTAFLLASDAEYVADEDVGQPIELYGTGFRGAFSLANWQETSPYGAGSALDPSVRNAFALGFNAKGIAVDVSNSVRQRWTPTPFSVGSINKLPDGELVPMNTTMRFVVDVQSPSVKQYLAQSLDQGRLLFSVTSLTKTVQQGSNFPSFYCRENPLVEFNLANAARIELRVSVGQSCAQVDLDCNGVVDAADLATLLSAWGGGGSADVNNDGVVDAADLSMLLNAWTN